MGWFGFALRLGCDLGLWGVAGIRRPNNYLLSTWHLSGRRIWRHLIVYSNAGKRAERRTVQRGTAKLRECRILTPAAAGGLEAGLHGRKPAVQRPRRT